MLNINCVLTSKGGVGKSLICSILGCYFQERGRPTLNLDLDVNQPTFHRYAGLEVKRVELKRNGTVDARLFDGALTLLHGPERVAREDLEQAVIDIGAGSYLPYVDYLSREEVMEDFEALDYSHTLHVVLAGGQALNDCLRSLDELASLFGRKSRVVVWLNSFFEALPWEGVDGFVQSGVYAKHQQLIDGVLHMPNLHPQLEGPAFSKFAASNQTFREADASAAFVFTDKKRLRRIKRAYYAQLDFLFGLREESEVGR